MGDGTSSTEALFVATLPRENHRENPIQKEKSNEMMASLSNQVCPFIKKYPI